MSFSLKPDYELVRDRYEAFWHQEVIDRALIRLKIPVEKPRPVPTGVYAAERDRWLDLDFRADAAAIDLANYHYMADALPVAWPNMGPEIFSAWCGCGLEFGETTTWSVPCIRDWERDYPRASLDSTHPLLRATMAFTKKLLERGEGKFIVGLTDFHPGGDHIAALRDPQTLAIDMIENLDWVRRKLAESYQQYFEVYDLFYEVLRAAGMPITSWCDLIHEGKYYIPSNDFSCMISTDMFVDVFLQGIIEECRFLDRSIYHLDGPAALRHLDVLLDIPELDAIQWVAGAGNGGFSQWVDVYRRIQGAGKSMQVTGVRLADLDLLFDSLRPEGVWICDVAGVDDRETAEIVIERVVAWR